MKYLILFLALASAATAGDVTYPVQRKSALSVSQAFNRMSRENVGVTANVTGRSVNSGDSTGKTIDVSLRGNGLGQLSIECLYVIEAVPGTSNAGKQRVLVGGQGITDKPSDEFQFHVGTLNQSSKLKGWFVRVVKNGAIVGVAGSSPKFEEMAADPKTEVRYGEK